MPTCSPSTAFPVSTGWRAARAPTSRCTGRGTWAGTVLDGQIGQSYSTEAARYLPPKSGLNTTTSDIVGHVSFTPSQYLDLTYRTRLDKSTYQTRLADLVATAGAPALSVNVGYLRTSTNPYALYDLPQATPSQSIYFPRDEATVGFSSKVGEYRLSGYARRDLATNQMVEAGGKASFENECYILDVLVDRRYTSINNDNGVHDGLVSDDIQDGGAVRLPRFLTEPSIDGAIHGCAHHANASPVAIGQPVRGRDAGRAADRRGRAVHGHRGHRQWRCDHPQRRRQPGQAVRAQHRP